MNIRSLEKVDFYKLEQIHKRYYKKEFDLPDFMEKYICAYTVHNGNDIPILSGGVRTIAEIVALTDKSRNAKEKYKALYKLLDACMFSCHKYGYEQFHAFVQDEEFLHTLLNRGFRKTKGVAVVIDC